MTRAIRLFLFFEGAAFIGAALVHFGVLLHGYEHREAGIAESVIGVVLLVSLLWTWIRQRSTRTAGLAAQAFALFGTFVGLYTIAIGVGPRTALDAIYHIGIILVLVTGLIVARRVRIDVAGAGSRPKQSPIPPQVTHAGARTKPGSRTH